MNSIRRMFVAGSVSAALACCASAALAPGSCPDKSIKLSVGFAPGTGPDVLTRTVGEAFAAQVKQSVVIDNRTGAGGRIAAGAIARAAPDGYNLLVADVGAISIAPAASSKVTYDPLKDLVVATEVARVDIVLVVPASLPAKNVAEFVQLARAAGRPVPFATFGAGTLGHFGAVMLADMAGYKAEPIHFRQTSDVVTAPGSGEVQGALMSTPLEAAQIKGVRMRALATIAAKRLPLMPDVPTFAEVGYPKADFSAWFAIFLPAGTP